MCVPNNNLRPILQATTYASAWDEERSDTAAILLLTNVLLFCRCVLAPKCPDGRMSSLGEAYFGPSDAVGL